MAENARLVDAARAGDEAAFRQLVEAEAGWAYGLAVSVSHSRADAEDAFQEAVFKAWRELGKLRDPERWVPWFRQIVVRCALDAARKARRARVTPMTQLAMETDRSEDIATADELAPVLARLDPEERVLIALRYGHDLELPEVARIMNVPLGTAKSRQSRILEKVRQVLQKEGEIDGSRGSASSSARA